jgi:HAD superfamily hydrolase (TIGR01509 family)
VSEVEAVVFDVDGVLVDSETIWDDARRAIVSEHGGTWPATATRDMMGMSSPEWSNFLHNRLGVELPPDAISSAVVARVAAHYEQSLPLLPHAPEAVRRLAGRWPLGVASSSNRPIIERFLDASGLRACFAMSVSSEEVARGKPAPDVYLEAARRLHVEPDRCVAVEDSTNGIRAAAAAGMATIAVPNAHFPPERDALALATVVIPGLAGLTVDLVSGAGRHPSEPDGEPRS